MLMTQNSVDAWWSSLSDEEKKAIYWQQMKVGLSAMESGRTTEEECALGHHFYRRNVMSGNWVCQHCRNVKVMY